MPWSLGGRRGRSTPILLTGGPARLLASGLMLIGLAFAGTAAGVIAGPKLTPTRTAALFVGVMASFLLGGACALAAQAWWALR